MIGPLDHWLEKKINERCHKKCEEMIAKAIDEFHKLHPTLNINKLKEQLETETHMLCVDADESTTQDRLLRARFTFWGTALLGTALAAVIMLATHGSALALVPPVITAVITWGISLNTIPITYIQRLQGRIDTVIFKYEKTLEEQLAENKPAPHKKKRVRHSSPPQLTHEVLPEFKEALERIPPQRLASIIIEQVKSHPQREKRIMNNLQFWQQQNGSNANKSNEPAFDSIHPNLTLAT